VQEPTVPSYQVEEPTVPSYQVEEPTVPSYQVEEPTVPSPKSAVRAGAGLPLQKQTPPTHPIIGGVFLRSVPRCLKYPACPGQKAIHRGAIHRGAIHRGAI